MVSQDKINRRFLKGEPLDTGRVVDNIIHYVGDWCNFCKKNVSTSRDGDVYRCRVCGNVLD